MSGELPAQVLVADDDETFRVLVRDHLTKAGCEVDTAADGAEALSAMRKKGYDVAILDIFMPRKNGMEVLGKLAEEEDRPEVIVLTGHGTIETAIEAMKLGAYDYLTKPPHPPELVLLVQKASERRRLRRENRRHQARAARFAGLPEIVTQDRRVLEVLEVASRVAPTPSTVLITGESGTGKELVAQTVHRLSNRRDRPMVTVNCAALPESLLESELFGHEKGAFTGAVERKLGLFELADEGTLFMDEVGDLAQGLQGKLLRVLEERAFRRVGGLKSLPTDFRLIAATNQPLGEMMESGSFRTDLYFRLNTFILNLPPLRERPDDIPLISRHLLRTLPGGGEDWRLTEGAVDRLMSYSWPGNVRELRNVLERTVLLAEDPLVGAGDLFLDVVPLGEPERVTEDGVPEYDHGLSMEAVEERHIARVLTRTGWHRGEAAELLGISPKTLYRKIKKYGLEES